MEAFWPGPLTLLAPKHARIPEIVTAGLEKVGVRMPAHPVAHALLVAAGVPVAAPSANRFGRISPTNAYHVAEDLDGRIDAILDGGETTHGVESTVVDVQEGGCVIYRPGMITLEQLRSVCRGEVMFRTELEESEAAAPAPGMGVRHYAPRARLVLVEGIQPGLDAALMVEVNRLEEAGEVVGVMAPEGFDGGADADAEEAVRPAGIHDGLRHGACLQLGIVGEAGGTGAEAVRGAAVAGCGGGDGDCVSAAGAGGDWVGGAGSAVKSRE